jgi:hypothetical protein
MSRAGFPEPMSGFDQIAGRFVEGSHPYASVPTLAPSAYPCNRSGASASFATLLLLSQLIVCCIHRLNLQPIPAIQVSQEPPVSENQVLRTWTPRSGHWRVHTTGHNLPVRVTFQFLLVVCPLIELNGRYSASKLMTSLPQPGQKRKFNWISQSSHSRLRIIGPHFVLRARGCCCYDAARGTSLNVYDSIRHKRQLLRSPKVQISPLRPL